MLFFGREKEVERRKGYAVKVLTKRTHRVESNSLMIGQIEIPLRSSYSSSSGFHSFSFLRVIVIAPPRSLIEKADLVYYTSNRSFKTLTCFSFFWFGKQVTSSSRPRNLLVYKTAIEVKGVGRLLLPKESSYGSLFIRVKAWDYSNPTLPNTSFSGFTWKPSKNRP